MTKGDARRLPDVEAVRVRAGTAAVTVEDGVDEGSEGPVTSLKYRNHCLSYRDCLETPMSNLKRLSAADTRTAVASPARAKIIRADFAAANQSLARGLAILQAFDLGKPEWGIRELGRELGLDRSVVLRLVQTLAAAGFLEKSDLTSRYRIGPRAFEVGQRYTRSSPLYDIALSEMRNLHETHNIDVYLAVRLETVVLYLGAIEADDVAFRAVAGTRGHLHSTSLGKVLLAFEREEVMREVLSRLSLTRLTPATRTSRAAVLKDIAKVRKLGYAVSDGENLTHLYSVGAPICDGSGRMIAAISGSYARSRMSKSRLDAMVAAITSSAAHISRLLGKLNDPSPVPELPIRLPGKTKLRERA